MSCLVLSMTWCSFVSIAFRNAPWKGSLSSAHSLAMYFEENQYIVRADWQADFRLFFFSIWTSGYRKSFETLKMKRASL